MKAWSLFPVISAPMPYQMALDELLFRAAIANTLPSPVLRIYFSSGSWTTVGYSDSGPYPSDRCLCKRITGGGRVEHGSDVIFSLIARKENDESFQSVSISYWKIHEAVKAALEKQGEKPRFYRCDEKLPKGGECFIYPIATDLELDGHKVAGGAQKRSQGALMHQESVQIPSRIDRFVFAQALREAFAAVFQIEFPFYECDPQLLKDAKKIAEQRYPNLAGSMQESGKELLAGAAV